MAKEETMQYSVSTVRQYFDTLALTPNYNE